MWGIRGRVTVHITVRSAANEISGWRGDVLQVRVTAPPLEGRANRALENLLAVTLHLAPARVSVVAGAASRSKVVEVDGMSSGEVARLLGAG